MGDLGILLGDLTISACGFAIIGMIAGVLLRSSVIAIAAGLAILLPVETILTDANPRHGAVASGATARVHRPRRDHHRTLRTGPDDRVGICAGCCLGHVACFRAAGRDC